MSGIDPAAQKRSRKPPTKAAQIAIFCRDGWLCRWCKKPVVFAPTFRLLERFARSSGYAGPLAYFHKNWSRQGAPLLDELGAVIDHVNAFSTGGSDSVENFVTACNKCNGQKSASPADIWSERPRKFVNGKYGEPIHWDGLSQLFVLLASNELHDLSASEREWLAALTMEDTGSQVPPNSG